MILKACALISIIYAEIKVQGQRDQTKTGPTFVFQPPNTTSILKWSNLNTWIIQSLLSKLTLKCKLNCSQVSKHWRDGAQEFYTSWMDKCYHWTESSFRNAMKNNVNCKEIYCRCTEEWKRNTAPTLIKEIDTEYSIQNFAISHDGTLLAAHNQRDILIYDSKDLRMQFSRKFEDTFYELYFNGTDSCIFVLGHRELHVLQIAEGLPTIHSVKSSVYMTRPWWADNIFLSGIYDEKEDTKTLYLNELVEKGNTENRNIQLPLLMIKKRAFGGIVQMDSCNVLVCETDNQILGLKAVSKSDLTKYQSKPKLVTPDHEFDCKGYIWDFVAVPDGKSKKLYILIKETYFEYFFLIIDLDSFQMKTSTLLVPRGFNPPLKNLTSNAKYMASDGLRCCAYVWDIKSGLCIAQLKHNDYHDNVSCAMHPIDPQLVFTVGRYSKKIKIWRLNNGKAI